MTKIGFSSFFGHLLEQIKMEGGGRISSLQILLTNCEIADILSPDYRWQATIGQYKKPASFSRSNQIEFSSSAHFLIYHWEHDRSNFCGRLAGTAHFSLFSLDWNEFDLWDSLLFLFQKFNLFRHAGVSRTYPYLKLVSKQGLTGSRYPTRPDLFFNYPTRPVPKIENDRIPGTCYIIFTAIKHSVGWEKQLMK